NDDFLYGESWSSRNDRRVQCAARGKNILRIIHCQRQPRRRSSKATRYLFLQWWPWIVFGLSSTRIVRTAANKDQYAQLHAACSLSDRRQSGKPAGSN